MYICLVEKEFWVFLAHLCEKGGTFKEKWFIACLSAIVASIQEFLTHSIYLENLERLLKTQNFSFIISTVNRRGCVLFRFLTNLWLPPNQLIFNPFSHSNQKGFWFIAFDSISFRVQKRLFFYQEEKLHGSFSFTSEMDFLDWKIPPFLGKIEECKLTRIYFNRYTCQIFFLESSQGITWSPSDSLGRLWLLWVK